VSKIKRSPLKDKPLRNPGQSLDEQIHVLISDYALGPLVIAVVLVLLAVLEWVKYYRSVPPAPILYSVVAMPGIGYALFRFFRVKREWEALRLGRDGEREVGQKLEALRKDGYEVFHDIIGDGFNIDHVVIGPAGLFTVETKTHRKRTGNPLVIFDGNKVLIDGLEPDRNPVVQAKAQASWLRELLSESTGHKYDVRPVIVYPGWFVDDKHPGKKTIWVINPKGLPSFLDHEPVQLSPEDVHLASYHLSRFVRVG
jgi:hypothetical protein